MSDVSWFADKKNKLRRVASHCKNKANGERQVVVSLTSYPPRIDTIWMTFRSIFSQTRLPDKIVLYLAKSDFPNLEKDLPSSLTDLLWHDFEIRWVDEDLKPHKKYYWAFREFPDALIVTLDDDLIYRKNLIEELVSSYKQHPGTVVTSRTHLIMFNDDGSLKPYDQWIYEAPHYHPDLVGIPSMRFFATTGAGTLFDPKLFPDLAFDRDLIAENCLVADDVWLKMIEVIAGIPVVPTSSDQLLNYIPGSQEIALCHVNTESGGNDVVIANLLKALNARHLLNKPFEDMVKDPKLDDLIR